jgi:hypothetical protein
MTGIESIVRYVANLTGKRGATGIESIVSIVANLTGKNRYNRYREYRVDCCKFDRKKGVGIPRPLGKQAPILETVYYCSSLAIL